MKSARAASGFPVRAIQARMIAPCGMNCALCNGHLRTRTLSGLQLPLRARRPRLCRNAPAQLHEQGQANGSAAMRGLPLPPPRQLDQRYRTSTA
jgi:hypothetical protein